MLGSMRLHTSKDLFFLYKSSHFFQHNIDFQMGREKMLKKAEILLNKPITPTILPFLLLAMVPTNKLRIISLQKQIEFLEKTMIKLAKKCLCWQ